MLRRLIITTLLSVVGVLALVSPAYAANLSVKLEQPQSPTRENSFKATFVALDILDRNVTAKCLKKGPSEGSFTQFGSDIALSAGGNTATCNIDSSILNTNGSFQFKVTAQAGGDSAESNTVTVDYDTSGPGTPTNYSKQKLACEYKISFKSADDGGQTSKVEIYRSDSTSFALDASTRIATVYLGSNQEGSTTNSIPDCNKTYYFAIRAFDGAGNGSGVAGDSETTVVNPSPTTTVGAIPVSGSRGTPQILGEATSTGEEPAATIAGESLQTSPTPQVKGEATRGFSRLTWIILISVLAGLVLVAVAIYVFGRSKSENP